MAARELKQKNGGLTKSVDEEGRTVIGYAASFNTLDSDGDVFQPGCFAKSLQENKDRILHLLQHDTQQPICRPSLLKEDDLGLLFNSPFPDDDDQPDYINETLCLYLAGVYKEHSVGFEMIKSVPDTTGKYPTWSPPWDPTNSRAANIITEAKLWEFSTVTWGANKNTPFLGVKDESIDSILKHIQAKQLIIKNMKGNHSTSSKQYSHLIKELEALATITAVQPGQTIEPAQQTKFLELLNDLETILK